MKVKLSFECPTRKSKPNGLYSQGTGAVLDSNTNYPSALICAGVYSDECHIVGGGNDIAARWSTFGLRFLSCETDHVTYLSGLPNSKVFLRSQRFSLFGIRFCHKSFLKGRPLALVLMPKGRSRLSAGNPFL